MAGRCEEVELGCKTHLLQVSVLCCRSGADIQVYAVGLNRFFFQSKENKQCNVCEIIYKFKTYLTMNARDKTTCFRKYIDSAGRI